MQFLPFAQCIQEKIMVLILVVRAGIESRFIFLYEVRWRQGRKFIMDEWLCQSPNDSFASFTWKYDVLVVWTQHIIGIPPLPTSFSPFLDCYVIFRVCICTLQIVLFVRLATAIVIVTDSGSAEGQRSLFWRVYPAWGFYSLFLVYRRSTIINTTTRHYNRIQQARQTNSILCIVYTESSPSSFTILFYFPAMFETFHITFVSYEFRNIKLSPAQIPYSHVVLFVQ